MSAPFASSSSTSSRLACPTATISAVAPKEPPATGSLSRDLSDGNRPSTSATALGSRVLSAAASASIGSVAAIASTWALSLGQLAKPYSRASACWQSASLGAAVASAGPQVRNRSRAAASPAFTALRKSFDSLVRNSRWARSGSVRDIRPPSWSPRSAVGGLEVR